jgi:hypothetical protein
MNLTQHRFPRRGKHEAGAEACWPIEEDEVGPVNRLCAQCINGLLSDNALGPVNHRRVKRREGASIAYSVDSGQLWYPRRRLVEYSVSNGGLLNARCVWVPGLSAAYVRISPSPSTTRKACDPYFTIQ